MVDVGVGVVVVAATVARTRWAPTTGGAERVSFQFRMTTLAQMGACRKPQQLLGLSSRSPLVLRCALLETRAFRDWPVRAVSAFLSSYASRPCEDVDASIQTDIMSPETLLRAQNYG